MLYEVITIHLTATFFMEKDFKDILTIFPGCSFCQAGCHQKARDTKKAERSAYWPKNKGAAVPIDRGWCRATGQG